MLRWIQNTGQIFRTLKRCLENDRPEKIIETGHREGDYEMLTDDISLYLPDKPGSVFHGSGRISGRYEAFG